jgi:glycosylphosphatidylinositol deacylase
MMHHGERLVVRPHTDPSRNVAHIMPVPIQPFTPGSKFTLLTNQKLDSGDGHGSLTVLFCSVLPIHSKLVFPQNLDLTNGAPGGSKLACKNAAPDVTFLPASTKTSVHAFDLSNHQMAGQSQSSALPINLQSLSVVATTNCSPAVCG